MQEIATDTLERAGDGDLQAFNEIYRSSAGFVYSIALRMARNTADAEEITQDVFVKAYKNLKAYEGRSSFKTWIYRIAMNTAINFCKKRSAEFKKRELREREPSPGVVSNEAEKNLFKEDAEKKLGELLGCLNEDQRACILLREIEGLDYRQIADVLKIELNTVRSRLKRAREAMIAYARQGGVKDEL
ncbi:MAG: sigma-70 family RNA polymerase sigma factor [Candidatus Omnitrophota bacterium]|nr:sigma-70 family RNA polymerase sigma factor [Candidatus Omnitrophota bacterium]